MKKQLQQKLFVQKSVVSNLSYFDTAKKFKDTASAGSSNNGCND